jgi:CheY-like chemotaxis protein
VDAIPSAARPPLLLVESDVACALRFSQAVRAAGDRWDLFSVPDLAAAKRYLNAALNDTDCRPAAVFVRLGPGSDEGVGLIAWIRTKPDLRRCFVVAIAAPDHPGLAPAAAHGADTFLAAPLEPAALALLLQRHL